MFGLSIWHIVIVLVVVFLLFGGRLSDLMGAAGRHLRSEDVPKLGQKFLPPVVQRILRVFFR